MEKEELKKIMESIVKKLGGKIDWNNENIIRVEHMEKGKAPTCLPKGMMAIYIFIYNNEYLKIGKAGPKTQNRFTYQHYNPSSCRSNLAKSLLNDKKMVKKHNLKEDNIKTWMKTNLDRTNIYLNMDLGIFTLNLFEIVLQYKFCPKYEGYKSQKKY